MSGIIGGWIADRILGTSNTVFYGGIFIMLGHLVLALPAGVTALFISMFLIIIGTGLLNQTFQALWAICIALLITVEMLDLVSSIWV